MSFSSGFIWTSHSKSAITAAEAALSPADRGFRYGDGVFETISAYNQMPRLLDLHLARLKTSCSLIKLDSPSIEPLVLEGLRSVLQKLREQSDSLVIEGAPKPIAMLRVIVTRGTSSAGPSIDPELPPTVVVWGKTTSPERPRKLKALTAKIIRNEMSVLSRIKSLNYLDMILARSEAEQNNCDDAVVLNTKGRVAETTTANIFAVGDGKIITPRIKDGCLPGIVRAVILKIATLAKFRINEQPIHISELRGCDEIFVTNSMIGVVPMLELDGQKVGDGHEGRITQRMRLDFNDVEAASLSKMDI